METFNFENGYALLIGIPDNNPLIPTIKDVISLSSILTNQKLAGYPSDH